MIQDIQNNEQWGSIRTKLNEAIATLNGIEEAEFLNAEEAAGEKLVKGSFVLFQSATDDKWYKMEITNFYDLLSAGL